MGGFLQLVSSARVVYMANHRMKEVQNLQIKDKKRFKHKTLTFN